MKELAEVYIAGLLGTLVVDEARGVATITIAHVPKMRVLKHLIRENPKIAVIEE